MSFPTSSGITAVAALIGLGHSHAKSTLQPPQPEHPETVPHVTVPTSQEAQIAELQAQIGTMEFYHQKALLQLQRYGQFYADLTAKNAKLETETKLLKDQLAERDRVITLQQSTLENAVNVTMKLEERLRQSLQSHRTADGEADAVPSTES